MLEIKTMFKTIQICIDMNEQPFTIFLAFISWSKGIKRFESVNSHIWNSEKVLVIKRFESAHSHIWNSNQRLIVKLFI